MGVHFRRALAIGVIVHIRVRYVLAIGEALHHRHALAISMVVPNLRVCFVLAVSVGAHTRRDPTATKVVPCPPSRVRRSATA